MGDIVKQGNPTQVTSAVPLGGTRAAPAPQTGYIYTNPSYNDPRFLETGQRIGRTEPTQIYDSQGVIVGIGQAKTGDSGSKAKTRFDVNGDGDSDVGNFGLILFLGLYAIFALNLSNGVLTKHKYKQKTWSNVLVWFSAVQLILVWKNLNRIKVPCTKEKVIYSSFVFFTLTASLFLPSIVELSPNKGLVWSQISLLLIGSVLVLAGPISRNNLVSLAGLGSLLVSLIITATTSNDVNDDEV